MIDHGSSYSTAIHDVSYICIFLRISAFQSEIFLTFQTSFCIISLVVSGLGHVVDLKYGLSIQCLLFISQRSFQPFKEQIWAALSKLAV